MNMVKKKVEFNSSSTKYEGKKKERREERWSREQRMHSNLSLLIMSYILLRGLLL